MRRAARAEAGDDLMEFDVGPGRIEITVPDRESLLAIVGARLDAGNGFALATTNVDHLEKLRSDARFRAAYAVHDLVVADGNPIVWLARLAGKPVSLVTGSDLVRPLCRLAASSGRTVAIISGTRETGEEAGRRLEAEIPDFRVAMVEAPGFPFDPDGAEADALLDELAGSGAGLCLLALGAPRQEILAARIRRHCPNMGVASVGAGIDFIAGRQRRAPRMMRTARIEWLWRAALSPRRLGPRYLQGAMILPGHAWRALSSRSKTR
ncbi:MAG: WecB/TagA/CpsF family glycosyltransferase [Pseudomonadota bacterium]|nr:WecB/TagA/CpsF family glycosyltransferase [Pseudomonadota bacterium]